MKKNISVTDYFTLKKKVDVQIKINLKAKPDQRADKKHDLLTK